MKIAHLSDIHLGIDDDDHARVEWLLGDALDRGAEHVVIAGDVLDHGNLEDLRQFKANLRGLDLWHPERLTVVPGNHDIIGASPHHKLAYPADSDKKRRDRHRRFVRAFSDLMVGAQRGRQRSFAHRKSLSGVELVAIDTTDTHCWMQGSVNAAQLEDLANLLRTGIRRGGFPIVVGHHRPIDVPAEDTPWHYQLFSWVADEDMNLADADELLGVVGEEGCNLLLCGHWHVLGEEEHYETASGVRVFTQGRSGGMDADDDVGTFYSYDLIDVKDGHVRRRTVEYAIEDLDAEVFGDEE